MAFVKLIKQAGKQQVKEPCLYVGKQMTTFNKAFCKLINLTDVGQSCSADFLYDKESDTFAVQVFKKEGVGAVAVKFTKSHQAQMYIKSMLKSAGYNVVRGSNCLLDKIEGEKRMWTFKIDKANCIDKDEEEANILKAAKKKAKRKKKNKRDTTKMRNKK